jgi:diguanylate cyclase (GGDEF)-like protein
MSQHDWPVTFSIGVLTCNHVVDSVEELIKRADELMYSAKNEGKNCIEFSSC